MVFSVKQDLIKQLNSARERLLKIMSKLPDKGKVVDRWGKKEILAHVASWEEEGALCIPEILKGEGPKSFRISIKRFNEESVIKRKDKTIMEILEELADLREQFMNKIEQLSEEQINGYYGTNLKKKQINVLWVINEAISHDNTHAKDLERKYKLNIS